MNPRFEAGIPDFMNGILNFSIHFNVVHRKVDWRNPKMKSLNSMPDIYIYSRMRTMSEHGWCVKDWGQCSQLTLALADLATLAASKFSFFLGLVPKFDTDYTW